MGVLGRLLVAEPLRRAAGRRQHVRRLVRRSSSTRSSSWCGVVIESIRGGALSPKASKALAVGLIEAIDVFLIAIAAYITSLGFYALFVDDRLPLPPWLEIRGLDDLKNNLVSVANEKAWEVGVTYD